MGYDLENRVMKFAQSVINFTRSLKRNEANRVLVNQVLRSATSIGANYVEANHSSSKKDFKNKISISRKEASESRYWLELIKNANPERNDECSTLWKESHELTLIFSSIFAKTKF